MHHVQVLSSSSTHLFLADVATESTAERSNVDSSYVKDMTPCSPPGMSGDPATVT